MKKILLIVGMLFGFTTYAQAFFIDFEDGTEAGFVNDISGVSFVNYAGFDARYGDSCTGYNTSSDDGGCNNGGSYHHNGDFFLWAGPDAGATGVTIDFTNNDGTWFSTGYSAISTFYMDVFFTDGTNTTIVGAANTGSLMGNMMVTAGAGQYIDYIELHDTGNYWIVDDMSGDATGIGRVPEAASLFLLGIGLLGLGFARRKQA